MRRSILCIIIIASLILCSTSIAFANPLDPWTSVQADRVTNGVISIDNTLSNVYTAISALYNYLKNNGDGVVEGLLVLANRVSNIISTIDYYLPNINTNLQNIYSSLAAHSGSNLDLWGLTNSILTNTNALVTGQLGIAQDVYNISGYSNAIQSKLTTLNSTEISSLAKLTNIDSNVDQVESQLSSVNVNLQSLENINWYSSNNFTYSFSLDGISYDSFDNFTNSKDFYLKIHKNNTDRYNFNLYKFVLPFYANSYNVNLDLIKLDNNYDFDYYIDSFNYYFNLYIYPFKSINYNQSDVIFHITSDYNIYLYSNINFSASCLNSDSLDFYYVDSYIQSHQNNDSDNLEDIKNILIDIDNNSDFIQNNNDLQINVDIDSSVGSSVTNIIAKLQDLFDFGVGLQEFLVTLNEFDNLHWFTRLETYEQVNYDPRTNLGYQDLYD